jgi:hypothetical protein
MMKILIPPSCPVSSSEFADQQRPLLVQTVNCLREVAKIVKL